MGIEYYAALFIYGFIIVCVIFDMISNGVFDDIYDSVIGIGYKFYFLSLRSNDRTKHFNLDDAELLLINKDGKDYFIKDKGIINKINKNIDSLYFYRVQNPTKEEYYKEHFASLHWFGKDKFLIVFISILDAHTILQDGYLWRDTEGILDMDMVSKAVT